MLSGLIVTMSVATPDQPHEGVRVTMEARLNVRFCSDDCGTPVTRLLGLPQLGWSYFFEIIPLKTDQRDPDQAPPAVNGPFRHESLPYPV